MSKQFNTRTYVMSWLRRGSYRTPMRYEVLTRARVARGKYICAICGPDVLHGRNEIEVDHIIPVIDVEMGFTTWEDFINRLFCPAEGLQVLCKNHHSAKSKLENKNRTKVKKKRLQTPKRKRNI